MKKLYIIFSIILIAALVSCSNQNYYEDMDPLDPPELHKILGDNVWITHELELNENEILLYAPRSYKEDGRTYLNDYENYYIYTIKPTIFQLHHYRVASKEDLKEIFG